MSINKNIGLSLASQVIPAVLGIIAVPVLIDKLGLEKFGILTLIWLILAYCNAFDFGISRALNQRVANLLASKDLEEIGRIYKTGLVVALILGTASAIVVSTAIPWTAEHLVKAPANLLEETKSALALVSVSLPAAVLGAAAGAVIEAHQRFDWLFWVRLPMSILSIAGPLAASFFTVNLGIIVATVVVGRLLTLVLGLVCTRRLILRSAEVSRMRGPVWSLLTYGMWITVSNLVGPLLLYSDRFIIAGSLDHANVAFYTTPYEIVTRFLAIPAAIAIAIFPAIATALAQQSPRAISVYKRGLLINFLLMGPIVLGIAVLAQPALEVWISPEVGLRSSGVARVLGLAVLINGFGLISQGVVQSAGYPKVTATLHIAELPIYFFYAIPLVREFGIEGAAISWLIRVSISSIALAWLAHKVLSRHVKI